MSPQDIIEAILFVAEEPVPVEELAEVLERPSAEVLDDLDALRRRLAGSGLVVREVAGGWRLYTNPETHPYLERFSTVTTSRRLSKAALEVLAIVAYQQPVSRGQIGEIRGVDSGSALRTLERRGLIEETTRLPVSGNPALYGTTTLFLEKLGIGSLDELPPLADHVPPADVVESLEDTFRNE